MSNGSRDNELISLKKFILLLLLPLAFIRALVADIRTPKNKTQQLWLQVIKVSKPESYTFLHI